MCMACIMLDTLGVPKKPADLVRNLNELVVSDKHKAEIYDKAIEMKTQELGENVLDFIAELSTEIRRDLLRKT